MLLVGSWNENQWICPFRRAVGTHTFWYFVQSAWVFTYTVSIFSCNTVLAWSTSDKFGAELVRLVICLSQEVCLDVSQLVPTWTSNRGSGEPWKFSTNYLWGSWCALFFFQMRQLELILWLTVGQCLQPLLAGSVSCLSAAMYLKIWMIAGWMIWDWSI